MSNDTKVKKRVNIQEDCNADDVELSVSGGDEVTWCSSGSKFTVNFKGQSPFAQHVYHVPAGQCCDSGSIVGSEGSYKYHISNEKGVEVDPAVIIRN